MKYSLPLIAFLSLTVSVLALEDATFIQKIVGTWKMSAVSLVSIRSDGAYVETNILEHSTVVGTWQVTSNSFVIKPNGKSEESLKIIGISDREFICQYGTNSNIKVFGLKQ
jgi:hypothetical protein